MVSKDQAIGGAIFIICIAIAILYVVTLFYPEWLTPLISDISAIRFWVIAIPVLVAFVAVMAIGAWIGWTMATTPPPKPIEEITAEVEKEKEEEKAEAKEAEEAKEEKTDEAKGEK
jgi:predicted DNA-binding transcriptional regulator